MCLSTNSWKLTLDLNWTKNISKKNCIQKHFFTDQHSLNHKDQKIEVLKDWPDQINQMPIKMKLLKIRFYTYNIEMCVSFDKPNDILHQTWNWHKQFSIIILKLNTWMWSIQESFKVFFSFFTVYFYLCLSFRYKFISYYYYLSLFFALIVLICLIKNKAIAL